LILSFLTILHRPTSTPFPYTTLFRSILTGADIATMAPGAVVFALANPELEVAPDDAREHAAVVATGRSDYPNQINNVLAFPGVRSEEHTSELQSRENLVCRLLLEKKK